MDARVKPAMTAERQVRKPAVEYSAGEIGRVRPIKDFLPSPAALVARENRVKASRRKVGQAKREQRSTV